MSTLEPCCSSNRSIEGSETCESGEQTTDLGWGELFVGCPYFVDPQFVRTFETRIATKDGYADHRHSIAVELVYVPFKVLASAGVCEILKWDLLGKSRNFFWVEFSWLKK